MCRLGGRRTARKRSVCVRKGYGGKITVTRPILPENCDVFLFTGNYGSGKTEVSVNVVSAMARAGEAVTIADLDLVNPYFRCREARQPMEKLGVKVVAPEADMHNADLPILLPQVRGAITSSEGAAVLDVGGDNVGATVLSSLVPLFNTRRYDMMFVLNRNRPFTGTVEGAMRLMDEIERASKLKVTAIVGNTHLMEETDLGMAREGDAFCREVAEARGVRVAFVTAPFDRLLEAGHVTEADRDVRGLIEVAGFQSPVLPLKRIMLPPWLGGPVPGSMATHARDRFSQLSGPGA